MTKLFILILASALLLCAGGFLVGNGLMLLGSVSFGLALLLASAVTGLLLFASDTLEIDFLPPHDHVLHDDAGLIH